MKVKSCNKLCNSHKNSYNRKIKSRNTRKIKGGLGLAMAGELAPKGTPEYEVNQKINFYSLNPSERKKDEKLLDENLDKLVENKEIGKLIDEFKKGKNGKINYKDDNTLKVINYDMWLMYHAVHSIQIPQKSWF